MPFASSTLAQTHVILDKAGFSKDMFKHIQMRLSEHQNPKRAAFALAEAHKSGLCDGLHAEANCRLILEHRDPVHLALTVRRLNEKGLLKGPDAQANFDAVARHQKSTDLVIAIHLLQETVFYPFGSQALALSLFTHKPTSVLPSLNSEANREIVFAHAKPLDAAHALIELNKAGLLSQPDIIHNMNTVLKGNNFWGYVGAVYGVINLNNLNNMNADSSRKVIAACQYPKALAQVMLALKKGGQLEKKNGSVQLEKLMKYKDILFGTEAISNFWNRIPKGSLSVKSWETISQICEGHRNNPAAGQAALMQRMQWDFELIRRDVRMNVPRVDAILSQTTHTVSVHRSTSQSAKRLMASYGSQLEGTKLDDITKQIKTWVHARPVLLNEPQYAIHPTAKRSIDRLTSFESVDAISNVSLRQLLALTWLAIHDANKCTASVEDAKKMYLEALYEAQRDGNISGDFEDDQGGDSVSCPPGVFNKLIEKLAGMHAEAEVRYITYSEASGRLYALVHVEAAGYAASHANDVSLTTDTLWGAIKHVVSERLFFEYGSLYLTGNTLEVFYHNIEKHRDFETLCQSVNDYEMFQKLHVEHAHGGFKELIARGELIELSEILQTAKENACPAASEAIEEDAPEEDQEKNTNDERAFKFFGRRKRDREGEGESHHDARRSKHGRTDDLIREQAQKLSSNSTP